MPKMLINDLYPKPYTTSDMNNAWAWGLVFDFGR